MFGTLQNMRSLNSAIKHVSLLCTLGYLPHVCNRRELISFLGLVNMLFFRKLEILKFWKEKKSVSLDQSATTNL